MIGSHSEFIFLVGAPKAATTALANALDSSGVARLGFVKEPGFFATDIDPNLFRDEYYRSTVGQYERFRKGQAVAPSVAFMRSADDYFLNFPDGVGGRCIDASSCYMFSADAAENIFRWNPNAKIIFVLRNPVDRAVSHYEMDLRDGRARSGDLARYVNSYLAKTHEQRSWGGSPLYIELGLYLDQLRRYYSIFPVENIFGMVFEDLLVNREAVLKRLVEFIFDGRDDVKISLGKENSGGGVRFPGLVRVARRTGLVDLLAIQALQPLRNVLKRMLRTSARPAVIDSCTLARLHEIYCVEKSGIEDLTGLDLRAWSA